MGTRRQQPQGPGAAGAMDPRACELETSLAACQRTIEALQASVERYRSMVEVTSDWIWEVDTEVRYTYASPRVRDLLGYAPEEVLGKTPFDLMPPDEARRVAALFEPIARQHLPFAGLENTNRHKDGHLVVLETSGVPCFDAQGKFTGYRGIDRDITARKRVEARAMEMASELQAIFRALPDLYFRLDSDGRIIDYRAGSTAELYVPPEAFLGRHFSDVLPQDVGTRFQEAIAQVRATGSLVSIEYTLPIGGEHRLYEARLLPLDGIDRQIVVVVRNITELKRLEKLRDEFLAAAAHELKTPVTTIKGYVQLMRRWAGARGEPRELRALEIINRQCDRLNRLIQELLEVSRLQIGRFELHRQTFDLGELAAETVEEMQVTTARHRLLLQREPDVRVNADRDRISQVLTNLLENGIQFSPAGGDIEMRVEGRNGEARVAVRDHGVGIPREAQPHIFERFFRAHAGARLDYGGIGIGLFVSREIVTRHGGRMWFESEPGKGSTFYFTLPLATPRAQQGASAQGA